MNLNEEHTFKKIAQKENESHVGAINPEFQDDDDGPIGSSIPEYKQWDNPYRVNGRRVLGRNSICFCGSGLKFKKCCMSKVFS